MAGDITFGIRLQADASGYVGEVKLAREETEKLAQAAGGTATKALRDMDSEMKRSMASAVALGSAIAQLATEAARSMVGWAKETIGAAAALNDLAKQTGSSVEALSAITNSFRVSGVDARTLETALQRLSVGLSGTDEESSKAGRALAALGIESRDPATALKELAVKLEEYKDGAEKANYIQVVLGRGAQSLLPALHDLAVETQFGSTVTAEQARQAEELEKAWRRLSTEGGTLKTMLLSDLVPALNNLIEQFIRGKAIAGGFWAAVFNFGTLPGVGSAVDALNLIDQLNAKIDKLNKAQAASPAAKNGAPGNQQLQQIAVLKQQIEYVTTVLLPQFQRANKALETEFGDLDGAIARNAAGLKTLPPLVQDHADKVKKDTEAARLFREEMQRLNKEAAAESSALKGQIKDIEAAEKAYTEATLAQVSAANAHAEAAAKSAQALEDELATFGQSRTALLDLTIVRKEDQLARLTDYDNYIPAYVAALESEIDALKRTRAAVQGLEAARANQRSAAEAERSWVQMIDSVARGFGDFLVDLVDNGGSAFKNLWDSFRNWALRALAEVATKQVVVSLVGSASLGAAGSAAASVLGGAGGIGSLLGSGGSLLGGIGSILGLGEGASLGIGTALSNLGTIIPTLLETGSVSAAFSGMAASFAAIAPWAAIGAIAIPLILSAFDEGPAMRAGTWMSSTGAMPRGNPLFQGSSAFGSFGVVDDRWFSDSDMGASFQKFNAAIASLDNTLAGLVGKPMTETIAAALAGVTTGFEAGMEHEAVTFGDIVGQRYTVVLNTIHQGLGDLLAGFQGTGEEMAQFVVGLVQVHQGLEALNLQGLDITSLQAFQQAGETLPETFNRVSSAYATFVNNFTTDAERLTSSQTLVSTTFADLGIAIPESVTAYRELVQSIDLSTEAGRQLWSTLITISPAFLAIQTTADAATEALGKTDAELAAIASKRSALEIQIMELSGDKAGALAAQRQLELDALDESLRPLQQRVWLLEDEAAAVARMQQTASARGTGGGGPTLVARPNLSGLAAEVDAQRETFAAALNDLADMGSVAADAVASAASQWDRLVAQGGALDTMAAYYDGSLESTKALAAATREYYTAAVQMVAAIRQIKQQVDDLFGANIRTFTMSGLDKQGQYEFLQSEVNGLMARLAVATDPAVVQALAQRIGADQMQAWGLLNTDQQGSVRQQFIDGALEAQRIADDRLAKAEADSKAKADQLILDVKNAILEASKSIAAAGDVNLGAARDFRNAVDKFDGATIQVDVTTPRLPAVGTYR